MEIKVELKKLREEYLSFLKKYPHQQNETIINKFLILISDYSDYEIIDHPLDEDAYNFHQRYKKPRIKTLQVPRTPETFVEDKDLASILSSGEKISDISIKIKDFNNDIKSFVAVSPISWVVGGVANNEKNGSKNDLDILITLPTRAELEKIIMFRIARSVKPEIRKRISFLPEPNRTYVGPFTNNLPLFRLTVERIPDAEVVKMAEEAEVKLRIKSKEAKKRTAEANKAIKDDKITPGNYYHPAKPVRGYTVGKPQTFDLFLDIYDKYYSYPSLSSKKYDGERILISKTGNRVTIFSEDGSKIDKLKNLKERIEKLKPDVCVIEGELENWNYKEKQHLPRESVNTGIDDDNFVCNIFEVLYYKGEIPDKLYAEIEYFDKEGAEKWKEKYL